MQKPTTTRKRIHRPQRQKLRRLEVSIMPATADILRGCNLGRVLDAAVTGINWMHREHLKLHSRKNKTVYEYNVRRSAWVLEGTARMIEDEAAHAGRLLDLAAVELPIESMPWLASGVKVDRGEVS